MTLEAFKDTVSNNADFADRLIGKKPDVLDYDNGTGVIHRENLNLYLEEFACKDEYDLSDTLWHGYGMFLTIVD